ncbi:MAG: putative secreted protein [Acidimicrobiales bacterium]|nr:putative secreted protein [Acidimicrobiales bacterium]
MRSIRRPLLLGAALVLVAGLTTSCQPAPPFQVSTIVGGLDHPWDLAFTSGGSMFFTERVGRIGVRYQGKVRTLATPADVQVMSEGGMLGLAIDPSFYTNRRIYTCFLSNKSGGLDVRVVRWRVNDAFTGLTNRTDILTGLPVNTAGQAGRHSGCRPRFGPDGYLWVGTGDAATGRNPQSPTSLGGKVLRITTDGKGAPGNAGPPFRPEIYNYGHRNVQGLAFSPGGKAYSIEHGTGRDDEVNLLVSGGNYGWDPVPPGGGPGYDESQPMTDLQKFPNAKRAVWSSGDPTIAPSGGTFIRGSAWGTWEGTLAVAVLKAQQLHVFRFDQAGTAVSDQWIAVTDQGRLRSAVQGPDGDLYVATDASPGKILRIHPTG